MKPLLLPFFLTALLARSVAFGQDDGRVITIPVVFHVFYQYDPGDNGITPDSRQHGNSTAKLTREKLLTELTDLDQDFQGTNPDTTLVPTAYKKVIGHARIHFILGDIQYIQITRWHGLLAKSNSVYLHQHSPVVHPETTLNVYTGHIIFDWSGTNGVTPVRSGNYTDQTDDAVNLNYEWVGLHYRLLTHEVGHWLGLNHVWLDIASLDNVTDLPQQDDQTDTDCDECPPDVAEPKVLTPGFAHANYQNFMDYSGCRVMFSADQGRRIRYVIEHYRPAIWAAAGH